MKHTRGLILAACLIACCAPEPQPCPPCEAAETAPSQVPEAARPPLPPAAPLTALVGASVFDGTGADPIADAVVLLERDRISAVGPADAVAVPAAAARIDLSGKWIVPGLIDTHVHFFQSGGAYTRPDILDLRQVRPYAEELEWIDAHLDETFRRTLASGVTAVVDVGGPFWNFDVRERARGAAHAPRVAVAGPLISTVDRVQLDVGDPPIIRADSADAARELVRAQLAREPDLIKVWFIVTPERGVDATVALLEAVVEESHRAGVRVAVHATDLAAARASVAAGADILVHSVDDAPLDEALVARMKDRGTILTPTLIVGEGYAEVLGQQPRLTDFEKRLGDPAVIATWSEIGAISGDPPEQAAARIARVAERLPVMQANLRRLRDAGVTLAAGTDAGNIGTLHGPSLHYELAQMAAAGLSPRDVLIAATRDAARVFAAAPEIGTVEPGKLADLLVLDSDPLADVANLARIHRVIKGGAVLEPDRIQPPNPEWVVQRQVDAYNDRDIDRFLSFYAADAQIVRLPSGEVISRGREEMRGVYAEMFARSPGLQCRIVDRVVQGRNVVDLELVTGIRGGPGLRAIASYLVEDGLITRVWFLPKD